MVKAFLSKFSVLFYSLRVVFCSIGDNSPFYNTCVKNCKIEICDAGLHSTNKYNHLSFGLSLWSCMENCEYECQWKTVDAFQRKNWSIPQFKGKWPFIRVLGFQEPASAIFSIINFFVNLKLLRQFRRNASNSTAFYYVWSTFALVQLNSWIWSFVYHTRETDTTEKLDYMSAFLVVLYSLYGVGLKYISPSFNIKFLFWSVFCSMLGLNHLAYLWFYKFDYGYNMKLNCIVGGVTLVLWVLWSFLHFDTQPFVWKIFLFAVLMSASMLLELIDFPPIFWVFDAHSLWHASSIIVIKKVKKKKVHHLLKLKMVNCWYLKTDEKPIMTFTRKIHFS